MKKQNFEFVVNIPPTKEIITRMHRELAKGLINKYGIETMKKILNELASENVEY